MHYCAADRGEVFGVTTREVGSVNISVQSVSVSEYAQLTEWCLGRGSEGTCSVLHHHQGEDRAQWESDSEGGNITQHYRTSTGTLGYCRLNITQLTLGNLFMFCLSLWSSYKLRLSVTSWDSQRKVSQVTYIHIQIVGIISTFLINIQIVNTKF